jgi:hypothetical protein
VTREEVLRTARIAVEQDPYLVESAAAVHVVTLDEFADANEPGAAAVLGTTDAALIPEGGDVMVYGDGGVGKTTLMVDLALHLAAGDDWLGIPIPRPRRVLLVENEGPRPLFRRKLQRKRDGWNGGALGDRVLVLEDPWGRLRFTDDEWKQRLADVVRDYEIDVVIAGPLTSSGMDAAGTLQEARDFIAHVDGARELCGRPIAIILVHHENKGGKVSGAWEGVGDTLLHVQQQGHGHVRLYVQKARWASEQHATTLQLVWADGDGFDLAEQEPSRPERTWNDIGDYVLAHGGCGWVEVEQEVSGQGEYLRRRRNQMLDAGELVNAGKGQRFALWHRDDPAKPPLFTTVSEGGHGSDNTVSATGDEGENRGRPSNRVPVSPLKGDTGRTDTVSTSPGNRERTDTRAVRDDEDIPF